jgi:amino acid transporter
MAFMGPALSVFFGTPAAATKIGYALPLGFLLAMLVCLIAASTVGAFSSKLPSAGFAYTFNTHAFNKGTGFVSGWILVLAYGAVAPLLFAAMGFFGSQFLASQFHWHVQWWIVSAVFIAVIWLFGSLGISTSTQTALIFLTLEIGVLLTLFITIIAKGGAQGNTLAPFSPSNSLTGLSGIGFGMLWGILSFVGFESAGTLSEETRKPLRSVPRALVAAVILVGIVYVLSGYAASIGFGADHATALAKDPAPWTTLSNHYWSTNVAWVLSLTVLNSAFAGTLAGSTAAVRVVFALGREGIFHRRLGTTNRRDNPVAAWAFYMLFSAFVTFLLGWRIGPLGVYSFTGSLLGLGMVVLYILMNIGIIRYFRRHHPGEFSLLKHGVLPVAGSLLMLLPIYGLLWPVPAWPYNLVPYLLLAWTLVGILYFVWIRRNRPSLVAAMGRVWEPDPGGNAKAALAAHSAAAAADAELAIPPDTAQA